MGRELLRLHDAQVRRDGNIILDVDDLVTGSGTGGVFRRGKGFKRAGELVFQNVAGLHKGMDGRGEGRRVGEVQGVEILHLGTHGDAGDGDVHHLVHRTGAQHLDAQQLMGGPVGDELGHKAVGAGIVVGLVVGDADHTHRVKPGVLRLGLGQAGAPGVEGIQQLDHAGAYLGNFLVNVRAYTYLLTLGRDQVKKVGPLATLNANYIKESLKDDFELPIPTTCMHEFVFNGLRDKSTGVTTMDVAKRLLDYGYHAPTIYFPLLFHEALMIEPTENESKETMDGFIAVMHKIAQEARETPEEVKSAPHNTPIGRVDDVLAAKHPITTFKQLQHDND